MMIYHAGTFANGTRDRKGITPRETLALNTHGKLPYGGFLESYHYIWRPRIVERINKEIEAQGEGTKVFLDSGAFSAWSIGATTDIVAYCEYIHANKDIIKVDQTGALMASVLDGIGDPLKTYRNQLEMEARGVIPLPCFHFGEPLEYLDHYVNNYTYITIGGMVGRSTVALKSFLDEIWSKILLDHNGKLRTRVHAFGITSPEIMSRYDWTSIDSSSAFQFAAFGNVFIPDIGSIPISDKNPARFDMGRHFNNMSPLHQDKILKYINDNGFDWDRLHINMDGRGNFNIFTLGEQVRLINERRSTRKGGLVISAQGLF